MEADFWHGRWSEGRIGFHMEHANPVLEKYFGRLELKPGGRVLVPLSGKTRDLPWLEAEGLSVTGVELVESAARATFEEVGRTAERVEIPGGVAFRDGGLQVVAADFLGLGDALGPFDAAWDRAALVALPPKMRSAYAEQLTRSVVPGGRVLLVAFEYDASEMNGPPFCVWPDEVKALYADNFELEELERVEVLSDNLKFKKRGLSALHRRVWLMRRRQP